jgi:sortase A
MAGLRVAERLSWGLGIALLLTFVAVRAHGAFMSSQGLEAFDEARHSAEQVSGTNVDHSLWSAGRIEAYQATLEQDDRTPLAVLRIPSIRLEVPVLDGTDEFTLNRAVGRIPGTGLPGSSDNVGIAGHRDGFFRGLKDVVIGDPIELQTLDGVDTYEVAEIVIVEPDRVDVLDPTAEASITLVTCYPFYFVGSAPQRYIVRATRQTTTNRESQTIANRARSAAPEGRDGG